MPRNRNAIAAAMAFLVESTDRKSL